MLEVNLLPKKVNEINYFKKNEIGGCTLYSYSQKKNITIICDLKDFEIKKDFCIDDKALNMVRMLSPIQSLEIKKEFVIKSNKGNYKSKLLTSDYMCPSTDFPSKITIDIDRLKIASCFVSTNEKRPVLTGVNVDGSGNIFASDTFIAYEFLAAEQKETDYDPITIPSEFINFISKEFTGNVDIEFNRFNCMVSNGNIKYISRLLEGAFPNVRRIYENKHKGFSLNFDLGEFRDKFNIAKEVGVNLTNGILLTFENGKFFAKGENDYEVDLNPQNHDASNEYTFTVAFDKLNTIISNLKGNNLKIQYIDSLKPLFIEDNQNEYLILPIKLG